MHLEGTDILTYSKEILEALESIPEVTDLTDAEAARQAHDVGVHPNYGTSDLASLTDAELKDRLKKVQTELNSLSHRTFLADAQHLAKLKAEVPKAIAAMQRHTKEIQAYYDKRIAQQEKLEKALDAYKAEVAEHKAAVEAEIRGRVPVTYAEMQELLKQMREGKA